MDCGGADDSLVYAGYTRGKECAMEARIARGLVQGLHSHPKASGNVRKGSYEGFKTLYNRLSGEPELVFQIEDRKADGTVDNYITAVVRGDLIAKVQELQWTECAVYAPESKFNRQNGNLTIFPTEIVPVQA